MAMTALPHCCHYRRRTDSDRLVWCALGKLIDGWWLCSACIDAGAAMADRGFA
ncbi:MAG: hypothetical protein JSS03_00395 [Proteobacteria bacterium]|nr:hypothetical protein [Pseudomonadota bacterium]